MTTAPVISATPNSAPIFWLVSTWVVVRGVLVVPTSPKVSAMPADLTANSVKGETVTETLPLPSTMAMARNRVLSDLGVLVASSR